MVEMGHCPAKSSIELMLWRMYNTKSGAGIIDRYLKAIENPDLWRETTAYILQSLTVNLKLVRLCAGSTAYEKINKELASRERPKAKDEIGYAVNACRINGYIAEPLFDYIDDCRNIFVHSGIMPYIIDGKDRNIGLNTFLRRGYEDNLTVLVSLKFGSSVFQNQGANEKFESLCNLILASFCFYFDSLNPALSRNSALRHAGLCLAMTVHAVKSVALLALHAVYSVLIGGACLIRGLFLVAFNLAIFLIITVIVFKVIGFFNGSYDTYKLTEVEPQQLVEWVDEISPYEQMSFMSDRRSSLAASRLYHRVGDPVKSPSDSVTECLYREFMTYPDPKANPFSLLPNPEKLSRIPVLGWPLTKQFGGEKQFTSEMKNAESHEASYLPLYQGDYYPAYYLTEDRLRNGDVAQIAIQLARYPKLKILLMYNSESQSYRRSMDSETLAKEIKRTLVKGGVKSGAIRLFNDPTCNSEVIGAVGNISYYR